jgi:hypothetical protein
LALEVSLQLRAQRGQRLGLRLCGGGLERRLERGERASLVLSRHRLQALLQLL